MNTLFPRCRCLGLMVLLTTLLSTTFAAAQRTPHIAYVYPAGCQQGTSCEVTLGGQYIKQVTSAYLSGEGVQIEVLSWYRPMTRGEYIGLNRKLRETREKLLKQRQEKGIPGVPTLEEVAKIAGITEEQLREMEIYRQRDRDPKRQPNEQLVEELTLRVTVDKDAQPGKRELRMLTDTAISNPIWFHVGQWAEVRETEPNDLKPDPVITQMPIVVNGQIMPGDVDTFEFSARRGEQIVIQAAARDVIPYLADAVPGWFQAVMKLTDAQGRELAYADSFHYRQDPVIYFEVPQDGRYVIQIHDTLYRGREDFVYRMTLGELPFLTSVFPLGARVDSEVSLELQGWNLPQDRLQVRTKSRRSYHPTRWFSLSRDDGASVRFPLQIGLLPEVFDQEPNNTISESQGIKMRTTVNGRIDHPGDVDVYRIEGHGRLIVEMDARKFGSPLDSILMLTDAEGRELAYNDDYEDKSQALLTHHADSHLSVTLSGSDAYYLHVRDAQDKGGREFIYRMHVRSPQPDYELRVVPSSIIARPGTVVPITVFALRRDGFDGDIELALVDPPPGFRLSGGVIPGTVDHLPMTLTVPTENMKSPVALEMEGRARIRMMTRKSVTRPVIPAENMMQAFIWHHLVPVENWTVIMDKRRGTRPPLELVHASPRIKLPREGEIILPARATGHSIPPGELRIKLVKPPPGVSAEMVVASKGKLGVKLIIDPKLAEPGWQGNLLFHVSRETTIPPRETDAEPVTRTTDYGYLPALPVVISRR